MRMRRLLKSKVTLGLALLADILVFAGPQAPYDVSRASLEAALDAQELVTPHLLRLDGVVGTAVGFERGVAVVKVYLRAPGAAVLPEFVSGVPVRPEVTGPFRALGDPPAAEAGDASVDPKRGFPRPVPIGVSTGHPGVSAGTIGARVTDGTRVFALSNNHVVANNNGGRPGDNLLQPGVVDGGRDPDDAIGTLHDFEPIQFCAALVCPTNRIDAAIALTSTGDLGHETPEDGYGAPRRWTTDADLGMSVQKYGRTTGHTHGQITGINAVIDVNYRTGIARFEDQIVISGRGFSTGGDSGSLIVSDGALLRDRRPVALLFAGSEANTIANPIEPVLERFGVRVDGGIR